MAFGNRSAAEKAQERDSSGGDEAYKSEIYGLYPDEVVLGRFYGGDNEPYLFHTHGYSKVGASFDKDICLKSGDVSATCEACIASSRKGETRVKRASGVGAFSFFSTRILLHVPTQKADGSTLVRKEPIHVNGNGQHIEKVQTGEGPYKQTSYRIYAGGVHPLWVAVVAGQVKWEYEGAKIWRGSNLPAQRNIAEILLLDKNLSRQCLCGTITGAGASKAPAIIQVESWTCPSCKAKLAYNEDALALQQPTVCPSCRATVIPDSKLKCSANCGNPRRGGLTSCYITIKRVGAGTDTTYVFAPAPFSEVDEAHVDAMFPLDEHGQRKMHPGFDFETIYRPSAETMRMHMAERGFAAPGQAMAPMGGGFGGHQQPPQGFGSFAPPGQNPGFAPPPVGGFSPTQPVGAFAPPPAMGGFNSPGQPNTSSPVAPPPPFSVPN